MSVKLRDLARELGITVTKLRQLVVGSKLDLKKKETEVSNDRAEKIKEFLEDKLKEKDIAKMPTPSKEKLASGIPIPKIIILKDFAEAIGKPVVTVISKLMENGMMINQNENIDYETAEIVADDLEVKIRPIIEEEDQVEANLGELLKDEGGHLKPRPPIITILGHVDHGKTTLLDKIRESNVAAGEAGGITQNISAYQISYKDRSLTFVDTPGHEAFASMRARGARVADLIVLVVAADDGVKPQTVEAIKHAKSAGIPILVAINKMDLAAANPDKAKRELADHDLLTEEWGGKTICAEISAKTGKGLDNLLEMILLTSEVEELKANPDRNAVGFIIEAHLDNKLGPLATAIIYTGTLRPNETIVAGETTGRVRLILDHKGTKLQEAGPAMPVIIAGFSQTPHIGDILEAVNTPKDAKAKMAKFIREREKNKLTLRSLSRRIAGGETAELPIILKTDNKGSLQAIQQAISKIQAVEAQIKIVSGAVGEITNSDVMMALATNAIIIGFNAKANNQVRAQADKEGVTLYFYDIIYHLTEELTKTLKGMLVEETIEVITGRGKVIAIFYTGKGEMTVGVHIDDGELKNGDRIRIIRDERTLGDGKIAGLHREKNEVKSVSANFDCGVKYEGQVRVKEGDGVIAFHFDTRKKELTSVSAKTQTGNTGK